MITYEKIDQCFKDHPDFEFMYKFMISLQQHQTYAICDWRCQDGLFGVALAAKGFNNVLLIDEPPDYYNLYEDYKGKNIAVHNLNDGLKPYDMFDVIICRDFDWIIKNKDWRKEIDFLIEHLRVEGLMYILSNNEKVLHQIDEDNCIYVQRRGYNKEGWPTIFEKVIDFEYGLQRFNYINRQIAGEVQKETLKNCIFNLAEEKEPILVIGGPAGEMPFPVKVLTLNIQGQSDFGNIRADRTLPIEDNSIGIIQTSHVLEHCEDTLATLKEWMRILKPGGIMLHIVPDRRHHTHLMDEDFKIGDRCFVQFTAEELLTIIKQIPNAEIIQFNTKQNKFDIDLIVRKKRWK